jgi:hypothetical protein
MHNDVEEFMEVPYFRSITFLQQMFNMALMTSFAANPLSVQPMIKKTYTRNGASASLSSSRKA